jgi:hypothetical protein
MDEETTAALQRLQNQWDNLYVHLDEIATRVDAIEAVDAALDGRVDILEESTQPEQSS